ncbi:hypothetical protein DWB61_08405 [Ancylomarina euxinus]|uniref:Uncharacterized protein n=1 Tax=Ancylomarina euxinus TaxID=2283627 RepID=A0A425Y315_9BACT|nr:hypothetical protein DWB61_08405 [Ancylomarina euxinus]
MSWFFGFIVRILRFSAKKKDLREAGLLVYELCAYGYPFSIMIIEKFHQKLFCVIFVFMLQCYCKFSFKTNFVSK